MKYAAKIMFFDNFRKASFIFVSKINTLTLSGVLVHSFIL